MLRIDKTVPQTVYDIYQSTHWIESFEVQDDATAIEYAKTMYTSSDLLTVINEKTEEIIFEGASL